MDNSSARDILKNFLVEKKLRPTRERLLLLDEIMKMTGHFDADQVYANLGKKSLKASRATVYNTLDLLVSCGLISNNSSRRPRIRFPRFFRNF